MTCIQTHVHCFTYRKGTAACTRELNEIIYVYNLSSNACHVFLFSISQIFVILLPFHTSGYYRKEKLNKTVNSELFINVAAL